MQNTRTAQVNKFEMRWEQTALDVQFVVHFDGFSQAPGFPARIDFPIIHPFVHNQRIYSHWIFYKKLQSTTMIRACQYPSADCNKFATQCNQYLCDDKCTVNTAFIKLKTSGPPLEISHPFHPGNLRLSMWSPDNFHQQIAPCWMFQQSSVHVAIIQRNIAISGSHLKWAGKRSTSIMGSRKAQWWGEHQSYDYPYRGLALTVFHCAIVLVLPSFCHR